MSRRESLTRPRAAARVTAALLAALFAACATDASFALWGSPGTWSRRAASEESFRSDAGACLGQSRAARKGLGRRQANEAAYATFKSCMLELGWTEVASTPDTVQVRRR